MDQDKLWTRLLNAFDKGNVLLTAGTGVLSKCEEDGTGLTGKHDYAILDLREDCKVRRLLLKNPWTRPTVWIGNEKLRSIFHDMSRRPKSRILLPGSFWMDLDTFCRNFESLYLNWNPNLFLFREDVHCRWAIGQERRPTASLESNPQFAIYSKRGGVVWVLLSRHLATRQEAQAKIPQAESLSDGYLSLYAFDNDGQKVVVDKDSITSTPFIDSPNILLKLNIRPKTALTIVLLSQQITPRNLNFSISALAINHCEVSFAKEKYTYHSVQEGVWDASQPLLDSSSVDSRIKSRYILTLLQPSAVYALLDSDAEDITMKIEIFKMQAVWSITEYGTALGGSGSDHPGPLFVEFGAVKPGIYMVICSTHRSRHAAKFRLELGTQQAFSIQPALLEDAGRLISSLEVARISQRIKRLAADISLHDVSELAARAWQPSRSLFSFRLAIEEGRRPYATTLTEVSRARPDGQWASVATPKVNAHPKTCGTRGLYVILEALDFSAVEDEIHINVQLISDAPLVAGPWHQIL